VVLNDAVDCDRLNGRPESLGLHCILAASRVGARHLQHIPGPIIAVLRSVRATIFLMLFDF